MQQGHTTYHPVPNYLHFINLLGDVQTQSRNSSHPGGCHSCQGTVGSSSPSCTSHYHDYHHHQRYPRSRHDLQTSGHSGAIQTCCGHDSHRQRNNGSHYHSNHPYLLADHVTSIFKHNAKYSSGITYSQDHTKYSRNRQCRRGDNFHRNCQHWNSNYFGGRYQKSPTLYSPDRVHRKERHKHSKSVFRGGMTGVKCESDPEYWGSCHDLSMHAQCGSCSSSGSTDRNQSCSSLECELCLHLSGQLHDSNHSTFGSSDLQDGASSHTTSCESNIFWGGAPDQMCTDVSSDHTSIPDVHRCHLSEHKRGSRSVSVSCDHTCMCGSQSSLNLSNISGCSSVRTSQEIIFTNEVRVGIYQTNKNKKDTSKDCGCSKSRNGACTNTLMCSETSQLISKDFASSKENPERHKLALDLEKLLLPYKLNSRKCNNDKPEESTTKCDNTKNGFFFSFPPSLNASNLAKNKTLDSQLLLDTSNDARLSKELNFNLSGRRLTKLRPPNEMFVNFKGDTSSPSKGNTEQCQNKDTGRRSSMVMLLEQGRNYCVSTKSLHVKRILNFFDTTQFHTK